MPGLNDSFLQELKMKIDIYDIISSYVTLKKRGNTYVGLCPFHNEKTPSFTVYPDTQSYYCFGCGAGGDAVGFTRKIENLDYIDAIKSLAQRAGMQMPEDNTYDDSLSKKRRTILEINRATAKFYHKYMMSENGRVGLNYFLNRGLSLKTIQHFGLGYAPDEWDALLKHLKSLGYSVNDMVAAGVVAKSQRGTYYDFFKNRVITPIIDVRGNVIAFGGRVLDNSKPKYRNTAETLVYKKTYELFAMNFAKDSGKDSLILCEGYMDVIAMHQAGFTNAVAGCGTALTNEQVHLISRYAKEVILVYDNDEAGQKALNKAISLFEQTNLKIRIPKLEGGKDPDEIIKNLGSERFAGMLEGASNEIDFQLLSIRSKYNLSTTQGKIDFGSEAVKVLVNSSPIEQDLYLSRISEEIGVGKNVLKSQLDEYAKKQKHNSRKKEYKKIVDDSVRTARKESYDNEASTMSLRAQDKIIQLLFKYPDCRKLSQDLTPEHFAQGFYRKVYSEIIKRLDANGSIDLIVFNEILTEAEMGKLSRMLATNGISTDSKKEYEDCAKILCDEYVKTNRQNVKDMDNDTFRSLFNNDN